MDTRKPIYPSDVPLSAGTEHPAERAAERARLEAQAAEASARRAEHERMGAAGDHTIRTRAAPAVEPTHIVVHTPPPVLALPRRRWAGVVGAGLIGAAVAALIVSNQYDDRSVGQRLDAGVQAVETGVEGQVQGIKEGAATVATQGAAVADRVAAKVNDASITASVKAALATDPALSALAIEVQTTDGVVRLRGPAPDTTARDRAGVLAAAPEGVRSVDNQLQVGASS